MLLLLRHLEREKKRDETQKEENAAKRLGLGTDKEAFAMLQGMFEKQTQKKYAAKLGIHMVVTYKQVKLLLDNAVRGNTQEQRKMIKNTIREVSFDGSGDLTFLEFLEVLC